MLCTSREFNFTSYFGEWSTKTEVGWKILSWYFSYYHTAPEHNFFFVNEWVYAGDVSVKSMCSPVKNVNKLTMMIKCTPITAQRKRERESFCVSSWMSQMECFLTCFYFQMREKCSYVNFSVYIFFNFIFSLLSISERAVMMQWKINCTLTFVIILQSDAVLLFNAKKIF